MKNDERGYMKQYWNRFMIRIQIYIQAMILQTREQHTLGHYMFAVDSLISSKVMVCIARSQQKNINSGTKFNKEKVVKKHLG